MKRVGIARLTSALGAAAARATGARLTSALGAAAARATGARATGARATGARRIAVAGATALAGGIAVVGVVACDSSPSTPPSAGDTVIVDVEASTTQEMMADGGASDDAALYASDAPVFGAVADAYGSLEVCATQCSCEGGTFCFAGGRNSPAFSGTCEHTSGLNVGCNPLPGDVEDCPSLLAALQGTVPCDPDCIPNYGMTVYCP